MTTPSLWVRIARVGFLGKIPGAPGTAASIVAGVPATFALALLPDRYALLVLAAAAAVACFVCGRAERDLRAPDPPEIVLDEVVGMLVTMVALPWSLRSIIVGVLAFRLFDIWKPWPVRTLNDELKGGLGCVLDDVFAGLYAHIVTWAVFLFWT